jgi:hypothetical protein
LNDAVATPIADVFVCTATLGQSRAKGICSRDTQARRSMIDGGLRRLVNQDLMGLYGNGDCGLPLKATPGDLCNRRFLHGLSDR